VFKWYSIFNPTVPEKEFQNWVTVVILNLYHLMAGYETLKKTFSVKSENKPMEQASLAVGGKRKRRISPYIFGNIFTSA
jgi:hypothetical protein